MVLSNLEMQDAQIVFAGATLAGVLGFLESSDCLSVLPESTVNAIEPLFGIRTVPINTNPPQRIIGVLSRPTRELDHRTRVFIDFLVSELAETRGVRNCGRPNG